MPVNAETINDRAKLILHRLVARRLAREPALREAARDALARMERDTPERDYVREWRDVLDGPADRLTAVLTGRDETAYRLRLSSPFATLGGSAFSDPALRRRMWRKAALVVRRT